VVLRRYSSCPPPFCSGCCVGHGVSRGEADGSVEGESATHVAVEALLLTNLQDLSVHKAAGQEGKDGGTMQGEGVSRRLSSEELSGIDAS
jgi:hypothetical protein